MIKILASKSKSYKFLLSQGRKEENFFLSKGGEKVKKPTNQQDTWRFLFRLTVVQKTFQENISPINYFRSSESRAESPINLQYLFSREVMIQVESTVKTQHLPNLSAQDPYAAAESSSPLLPLYNVPTGGLQEDTVRLTDWGNPSSKHSWSVSIILTQPSMSWYSWSWWMEECVSITLIHFLSSLFSSPPLPSSLPLSISACIHLWCMYVGHGKHR